MDKLFEAIDRYNEDKNEMALYENMLDVDVNYNEMIEILKDTLGDKFNNYTLVDVITNSFIKDTKNNGYEPLTDKDFD